MAEKILNLGCGERINPNWENYDFNPSSSDVRPIDLRKRLAFEDQSIDVIYNSHVIEHLSRENGKLFVLECFRILKKDGLLRLATPDLEVIAKEYLKNLKNALEGDTEAEYNYDWILLEMYDQSVRSVPGGDMLRFFCREEIPNWDYVKGRCGSEAEKLKNAGLEVLRTEKFQVRTLERTFLMRRMKAVLRRTVLSISSFEERKEAKLKRLLGPEYDLLALGRFRNSGEVHYWLYDRFSLGRLLQESGFAAVEVVSAGESRIQGWNHLGLDSDEEGGPLKPDSIFVEAKK